MTDEYSERGEYHRTPDIRWSYLPVYRMKLDYVRNYFRAVYPNIRILDVGCGEGVMVEEYSKKGYDITGVDLNYGSKHVIRGDARSLPFKDGRFDIVLALDVLEHVDYNDQHKVLEEMKRVLKPNGKALISVPNLAHLISRLSFLIRGKPIRTSSPERHIGELTLYEWKRIITDHKFTINKTKGLFPTLPLVSLLRHLMPERMLWLPKLVTYIPTPASWCFQTIIEAKK